MKISIQNISTISVKANETIKLSMAHKISTFLMLLPTEDGAQQKQNIDVRFSPNLV